MDEARLVREFWFGSAPLTSEELLRRQESWFGGGSPETRRQRDEDIRARFGPLLERAARGELDAWTSGARGRLSLILLLDQMPRNIFRGTARAFAHDARALELTLSGIESGADAALEPIERMFFYMPLQHAESLEAQEMSVALFRRLAGEAPETHRAIFDGALQYAQLHQEIIERFGRFPHRNRVLGRASTAEEIEYLQRGPESFGQ